MNGSLEKWSEKEFVVAEGHKIHRNYIAFAKNSLKI